MLFTHLLRVRDVFNIDVFVVIVFVIVFFLFFYFFCFVFHPHKLFATVLLTFRFRNSVLGVGSRQTKDLFDFLSYFFFFRLLYFFAILYGCCCSFSSWKQFHHPFFSVATGCLKKTWTFFEISIIPLFIKESLQNCVWLKQNDDSLLWGKIL